MEGKNAQPVIVIVTFGSSMEQGLRNLEDFDRLARERFPDHDIRWAWTAGSIIRKLARGDKEKPATVGKSLLSA